MPWQNLSQGCPQPGARKYHPDTKHSALGIQGSHLPSTVRLISSHKFAARSSKIPSRYQAQCAWYPRQSFTKHSALDILTQVRSLESQINSQIEVYSRQLFSADGRPAARAPSTANDILLLAVIPNHNQNPSLVALGKKFINFQ